MGAQEQHKGTFLKHKGGGGAKIFQQCHGRGDGGAIFLSSRHIIAYKEQ